MCNFHRPIRISKLTVETHCWRGIQMLLCSKVLSEMTLTCPLCAMLTSQRQRLQTAKVSPTADLVIHWNSSRYFSMLFSLLRSFTQFCFRHFVYILIVGWLWLMRMAIITKSNFWHCADASKSLSRHAVLPFTQNEMTQIAYWLFSLCRLLPEKCCLLTEVGSFIKNS